MQLRMIKCGIRSTSRHLGVPELPVREIGRDQDLRAVVAVFLDVIGQVVPQDLELPDELGKLEPDLKTRTNAPVKRRESGTSSG